MRAATDVGDAFADAPASARAGAGVETVTSEERRTAAARIRAFFMGRRVGTPQRPGSHDHSGPQREDTAPYTRREAHIKPGEGTVEAPLAHPRAQDEIVDAQSEPVDHQCGLFCA
jgi:hypothetical protein